MNKFLNVYNKAGYVSLSFESLQEAFKNGQVHGSDYLYTIEYNEHGPVHTHRPPIEEGYYEVMNVVHKGKLILYYKDGMFSFHKENRRDTWESHRYKTIRKLNI